VSATLLVTVGAGLAITALTGFVRIVGYSESTTSTILLVGLGLLPFALTVVCEAVFQAVEKARYMVWAQVPVNVVKVGLAYLLLSHGYGLLHLAILLLVCHGLVAGVEWWLMLRYVTRPLSSLPGSVMVSVARAVGSSWNMARSAFTFLGVDTFIAIGASSNIILLSALADERAVGIYSAAAQLMVPVTLIYHNAVLGAFPTICRKFAGDAADAMQVLGTVIALLFALAVPAAVGLFFLGDSALLILYGDHDFLTAAASLRIMVWTLIPAALTAVLGQVLFASVREKVTLRIVAIDALVGLFVGVLLITKFGAIGAAATAVVTRIVDVIQHYIPVSKLMAGVSLVDLCWKPIMAGTCMVVYLAVAGTDGFVLPAASAGAVYVGALLVLAFVTTSRPRRIRLGMSHVRSGQQ
jgi:O-antigen/teichoic acid export membrane protein